MLFHAVIAIFKNYISMTIYISAGQVTIPLLVSVPKADFTGGYRKGLVQLWGLCSDGQLPSKMKLLPSLDTREG